MNRYRPTLVLTILASLVVLLAACSSGSSASASPSEAEAPESDAAAPSEATAGEESEVRIVASTFEPGEITVGVGTEVVFINDDDFAHTITEGTDGDAVDDPIVDEEIDGGGDEVRVTFDEAGTYDITCEIHPSMQMTVTVEG